MIQIIIAIVSIPFLSIIALSLWKRLRQIKLIKNLRQEIVELKEKTEIQEKQLSKYQSRQTTQNDLEIYRKTIYRSKTTGQFYCITCFDSTGALIHVTEDNDVYYCGVCKKYCYPPN